MRDEPFARPCLGLLESALACMRLHGVAEHDVRWAGDRNRALDWKSFADLANQVGPADFFDAQRCATLTIVGDHFLLCYDATSRQRGRHTWIYYRLEPSPRRGYPDALLLAHGKPLPEIDTLPVYWD